MSASTEVPLERGHILSYHWKAVIYWGSTGKRSFIELPLETGHLLRYHWKEVIHWDIFEKWSFTEVPLERGHSLRYHWKVVIYWGTIGKMKRRKANTTKDLDNSSKQQWTRLSWVDRNNYALYILQSCIDVTLISLSAGSA